MNFRLSQLPSRSRLRYLLSSNFEALMVFTMGIVGIGFLGLGFSLSSKPDVDFEGRQLQQTHHEFLDNIQAIEILQNDLLLPEVEYKEKLKEVIVIRQRICRNHVEIYNLLMGNMSFSGLQQFEQYNVPLKLSSNDCE